MANGATGKTKGLRLRPKHRFPGSVQKLMSVVTPSFISDVRLRLSTSTKSLRHETSGYAGEQSSFFWSIPDDDAIVYTPTAVSGTSQERPSDTSLVEID